jgi:hypothetical protein
MTKELLSPLTCKWVLGVVFSVAIVPSVLAQSTFHVFPQIADGTVGSSTFKSAVMVRNASDAATANCTLSLYGLQAAFIFIKSLTGGPGGISGPIATLSLTSPPNGFNYPRTTGQQSLATGYATLSCDLPVYAQLQYSLYVGSAKIGETAVFSAAESPRARFIVDQTEGAHLGVAISNNTTVAHDYRITTSDTDGIPTGTATVHIEARSNLAKFLDELLPGSANAIGSAIVQSLDGSNFSAVGLRFTGAVFAAVPATP